MHSPNEKLLIASLIYEKLLIVHFHLKVSNRISLQVLLYLRIYLVFPFGNNCNEQTKPPFFICFHSNRSSYCGSWTKYTEIYNAHWLQSETKQKETMSLYTVSWELLKNYCGGYSQLEHCFSLEEIKENQYCILF